MRKLYTLPSVALLAGLAATGALAQQDYKQNAICVDGSDTLCSTLPVDMPGLQVSLGYNPDTNAGPIGDFVSQTNFDYFAWQMFVALNWPADSSGQPSTSGTSSSRRSWNSTSCLPGCVTTYDA